MRRSRICRRRNAKAVNFGIVYGISSFGLSQDLSISKKEAAQYIEQYFETYPKVKKFIDKLVADAKNKGYTETMFGRRRPIPELSSSNFMQRSFGERVAMNAPIQGTAADIIKIAMIKVWKALKEEGLKSRLILQVHDELSDRDSTGRRSKGSGDPYREHEICGRSGGYAGDRSAHGKQTGTRQNKCVL